MMSKIRTLEVSTPSDREIRMTRVFDAPRHLVFAALTKPELLKRWFAGPPGWTLTQCEFDARVGGKFRYVWEGPNGITMGMRGELTEIVPPERIVNTETFDESWYAGSAVGTITLTEQDAKTTLVMTVRYDSKEVRDAVLKSPMDKGVESSYNRLAELLPALLEEKS